MTGLTVAVLAIGVGVAAVALAVLRLLPAPVGEPPDLYRRVPSLGFAALVGLVSTAATAAVALRLCPSPSWLPWAVLSTAGVLLATVDAWTGYLPTRAVRAVQAGVAVAVVAMPAVGSEWTAVLRAAVGAAVCAGVFGALWLAGRGALGAGDVRFLPAFGAAAAAHSWAMLAAVLLLGSVAALLSGVLYRALARRRSFPYSPGFVVGCFVAAALLG